MLIKLFDDNKPIIKCSSNSNFYYGLLDTGAAFSVFTRSIKTLKRLYPEAYSINKKIPIGGFSGNPQLCCVYIIPKIIIGGLLIYNLPVAVDPNDKIEAYLILSSVIFKDIPFTIDYSCRTLALDAEAPVLSCKACVYKNDINYIDSFSVKMCTDYLQVLCERYNLDVEVVTRFLPKDYAKLSAEQLKASVRYISDMM